MDKAFIIPVLVRFEVKVNYHLMVFNILAILPLA